MRELFFHILNGAAVRIGGAIKRIGSAPGAKYSIKPQDDPVYLFLLKKEQEGKHYNVAKMAAVNKFLRIYYARVMELEQ